MEQNGQKRNNSAGTYTSGRKYGSGGMSSAAPKSGAPTPRSNAANKKAPTALTGRNSVTVRHAEKERRKNESWNNEVEYVKGGPDWVFGAIVLVLVALGIVMIYSASFPTAIEKYGSGFFFAGRQIKWALWGIGAMIAAIYFIPTRVIKKAAPIIYLGGAGALAAVLVLGTASKGAKRWIMIGGQKIQPSELAKLTLIIALAWYADKWSHLYKDAEDWRAKLFYGVLAPAVPIGLYAVLVMLENHLSGTIIIVAIGLFVMFLSGASLGWTAAAYGAVGIPAVLFYIMMKPYALERVYTYINKENADILGERWQTYQGTLAIGSGGLLGIGFGQSRQKHSYVSEAQNDFIFTIWCEEMGFIGAVVVIAIFAALVIRGYKIALRATDTFSSLLVFGIMTQVAIQVILNILVVTDTIPNTGISLPFLSYGGSSLLMFMGEMGLVMGVSRRSFQKLQ